MNSDHFFFSLHYYHKKLNRLSDSEQLVSVLGVRMRSTLTCVLGLFWLNTLCYGYSEVPGQPTVTLQPNWSQIFSGETITVRCEIQGGGNTAWTYEWKLNNSNIATTHSEYKIISVTESDSGEYKCRGRKDSSSSTQWSDVIRLTLSSNQPKAKLRADRPEIPVGGRVTLTCSVDPSSSDWEYVWYRDRNSFDPLKTQDAVSQPTGQISVSQEGVYSCRGKRGTAVYSTWSSDSIRIIRMLPTKPVVTLQPNWPQIYRGEGIMLRCEIHDADTEWEYEWESPTYTSPKLNEYKISEASSSHSGDYRCRGNMKNRKHTSTKWSDVIRLTVSDKPVEPVLTVCPSWLSPGDSVTLSCEVEHPSAGWRFYWYKADPNPSRTYSYELLPGSTNGTEQNSSIIHGATHTAGYVCRAGRGDPVYYTDYSKPQFVWSGDSSVTRPIQPERTNQDSAANHMINLNEPEHHVSSSLLHGDANIYESTEGHPDNENGKRTPAATDETLHSQVKPGTSRGV